MVIFNKVRSKDQNSKTVLDGANKKKLFVGKDQ